MEKKSLELVYHANDICSKLKVKDSNLKEWCSALNLEGYTFKVVKEKKSDIILFCKKDIEVLSAFNKLLECGFSIQSAATCVTRMGFLFVPSLYKRKSYESSDESFDFGYYH